MNRDAGDAWPALTQRGLQLVLVGLIAYGAVVGRIGILVNSALALGITFGPAVLERRYGHEVDPRLSAWIALAATVHAVGFLGPYEVQSGPLSWYDSAAHAISAGFVAGVGYAVVEALDRNSDRIRFPDGFRFAFTLLLIMAFGVAWEIVEFAGGAVGTAVSDKEILVQYGISDIVNDLVFNTLAAVFVALWGTAYFEGVATMFSRRVFGTGEP